MNYILLAVSLLVMSGCSSSSDTTTASTSTDSTSRESPKKYYSILEEAQPGNFKNYEILIDSASTDKDSVALAIMMFKAIECGSVPCNVVGVWNNEKAFTLYKAKSDNAKWRKENWPDVCEHYVAEYNATVNELNLYPFLDSEYRRWGGKKKRPNPHTFELP